jgi:hypothetical protein
MATNVFEIPLSGQSQTFNIVLASVTYQLTLTWRNAGSCGWILDIADSSGNPLIQGIPLVTGADLLAQYRYLGFTGSLVVKTDADPDAVPTYDNLGSTSHLYFVVTS